MNNIDVLLIEDDADLQLAVLQTLKLEKINTLGVSSVEEAQKYLIDFEHHGIIVTDMRLPGVSGTEFQRKINIDYPDLPVIIITGHGDIETAVKAIQSGAYDFIQKPFSAQQIINTVRRALDKRRLIQEVYELRRKLVDANSLDNKIIGNSISTLEIKEKIKFIAGTPANVTICGETGTGKQLLAQCIHEHSGRKGPFVAINCAALPESLFDSEIFGHEIGAFPGATAQRIGKLEYAHNGTLFFDKIESMPLFSQIKLLRFLQEKKIERLGSNEQISLNVRVISSSKEDLFLLAEQGKFRGDLNYRLNVINIKVPPLRDRVEDIPLLFAVFVNKAADDLKRPLPEIKEHKLHQLMTLPWLGNVRELRNEAERFVLGIGESMKGGNDNKNLSLQQRVEEYERGLIVSEMKHSNGNLTQTAKKLNIAKSTLFDKMKKHKL